MAIISNFPSEDDVKVIYTNYNPGGTTTLIPMPIGTKYKFGSSEQTATTTEVLANVPVNGYVKYTNGTI